VTLASLLQLLFPALVVLVLIERRAADRRRSERPAAPASTEWQTWRIVRWDDETAHDPQATCRRDPVAARRTARNQRERTHAATVVEV
jgi:hypothetical protein